MKKVLSVATMVAASGLMTLAFAATSTVRGYVMDKKCSTMASMKGNVSCVTTCLKSGQDAVLVEDSGTVLNIANKAAIMKVAGRHAVLTGTVADGAITVATAKPLAAKPTRARKAAKAPAAKS